MAIAIGSVEVDIVPSTRGIYGKLRDALVPAATRAGEDAGRAAGRAFGPAMNSAVGDIGLRIGQQIGQQIAVRITAEIRGSLRDGITQGGAAARPAATRQGDETAGAFARAMRARLQEAFRSLPKVQIGANTSEADSDLQALRERMEALSSKTIGVDISAQDARAEIDQIEAELRRLGSAHPDVTVRADTAKALAALEGVREEIDRISADRGTVRLETDGAFGARLRAAVRSAEAALPHINVDANTDPAVARLASLREQLTQLRDQRVGIDISAADAQAKIDEIRTRLAALGASSPNVAVRIDSARAEAQLAAVLAEIKALDASEASPKVDVSGALSAVFQLTVAIGALAALPALPILAAGTGSVTAAFTAAGVGVGAFAAAALPALSDIKGALDAQKQAQDAATTATAKSGQTAAQAASRALQMAGAQQALATAERNASRQIAQANQQVAQAKQAVADAVQQAAQRQQQADRAVATAEKDLTAAQKEQKQAQLDLISARKTAAEQLVDLNNQQKDSVLALRRAQLQLNEAQAQLDADRKAAGKAGSKITADQLAQDQLAVDEAKQSLAEQQIATKRLSDQTTAANKAGVTGSDTYKQAQDALAQAQQNVADKAQAVRDAQAAQAQTEVQNAKEIAAAQAKVVQAEQGVADAQASAADSIASAQRQIASASLSSAKATDSAATAQDKYQAALNKLTPAARGTFTAFLGLRTAFKGWSRDLQPEVMPIFTRGINGAKNSLPGLTPLVRGAARGIGDLQDMVSKGFKKPWWQQLKRDFAGSVEPAIVRMGKIIGNTFVGLAGIVDAFLPHLAGVSNQSDGITRRFANWGKNLKTDPRFANFLAYSNQQAPKLADALGKIGRALLDISEAVSPLSGPALAFLGVLASGLSAIATSSPGVLQLMYGVFVATRLATLAQLAYNGAMTAYRAGLVLTILLTKGWAKAQEEADVAFAANPAVAIIVAIVAALVLLVAGILWAWNHWAWFRTSVLAVWHAIQIAVLFTWNSVLRPVFNAIAAGAMWLYTNGIRPAVTGAVIAYQALATAALWLWQVVLAPVFHAISVIFSVWWAGVKIYFTAVITIFKMWAAIVWWVYQKTLAPVFHLIAVLFSWWWGGVKLYFGLVIAIFKALGTAGAYLWSHYLKPAFSAIGDAGKFLWSKALSPAFGAIKSGIKAVGDSFVSAKKLIGQQWSQVADLAKKPVSFLINTVYNKGIIAIWNKVADIVKGPHLKPVQVKGFARGGVAEGVRPGYTPGRDNQLIAVGGGEAVMRPEWTRAVGPAWVDAMNAAARSGGVTAVQREMGLRGFFGGGIIDTIGGAAKDVGGVAKKVGGAVKSGVTTGIDWAKTAVDLVANPGKVWDKLVSPIKNLIGKAGDSSWAKLLERIPTQALKDLGNKVKELVGLGGGGKGYKASAGITQWIPTILQALALLGQPQSWLPTVERRMNQESGGNPTVVNTWDSNWKAGHPSVGLMQVIAGTFQHYAGAFRGRGPFSYGVSVDPLANTYAGLNYALHRYGSLSALNRPGGYDSGGYLQPGLNLAYNGTGRPEPVLTTGQTNALLRLATEPAGGGTFTGDLYLSGGEFLGKVRGLVREENHELLRALTARPR